MAEQGLARFVVHRQVIYVIGRNSLRFDLPDSLATELRSNSENDQPTRPTGSDSETSAKEMGTPSMDTDRAKDRDARVKKSRRGDAKALERQIVEVR